MQERNPLAQNLPNPEARRNTDSSQQSQNKTWEEIFDLLDSADFPPEFLSDRGQYAQREHRAAPRRKPASNS